MLDGFPDDVAAFAFHGHVTKSDYDTVLVPGFEDKLTRHKRLRIYCEISSDLTGLDPGAVWADSKFGVGHYFDWDRCAIVSDVAWVKHVAKLSELLGFLWPGKYRTFSEAEAGEARRWLMDDGGKRGVA
ncbi:STAS/SEC14 domain-containing protein [Mycobacterium sp. SMC-2]|uniref:STAS/SEC14 domain-containing protein n=1 Tax=Mycobacterium sp. SMC-2 TaxID=2857058 RepID=UPI0021B25557|nr:STAS/SEC14 domain-containing protein [Mycobacterium sp. SMC-2]